MENARATARGGAELRLAAIYVTTFAILGVQLPYLPLWLGERGLQADGIAIVAAVPNLVRVVVSPAVGALVDRTRRGGLIMVVLAALALAATGLLAVAEAPVAIGFLVLVLMLALQSLMPLTDATALAEARAGSLDYGRTRMWGSIAFVAANVGGGLAVARAGAGVVATLLVLAVGALLVACLALSASPRSEPPAAAAEPRAGFTLAGARSLLGEPWFLLTVVASSAVQGSHALVYAFGSILWRAQGIDATAIGVLWGIGVTAEVVLFAFAWRLPRGLSGARLIALGALGGLVRWLAMALAPPLWLIVPLQVLHALTFAATHLGTMRILSANARPELAATAQSISASMASGLAMGLAMLAAGPAVAAAGAGAYVLMAALAGFGLIAALALERRVGSHVSATAP